MQRKAEPSREKEILQTRELMLGWLIDWSDITHVKGYRVRISIGLFDSIADALCILLFSS